MNLYLAGFQGVGKSYFGKRLAGKLQVPFIDVDQKFLELDGGNHTTIRDLYTTLGKEGFRNKEQKVVQEIVKRGDAVVALGGGTLLSPVSRSAVLATGRIVYMYVAKESLVTMLQARLLTGDHPAYLQDDPIQSFLTLYEERHQVFSSLAYKVLELEKRDNNTVLETLQEIWQEIHHGKQ